MLNPYKKVFDVTFIAFDSAVRKSVSDLTRFFVDEEKDLLQMMIAATEEGDKLTDEELIHNVSTLFIGGQETASSSKYCFI